MNQGRKRSSEPTELHGPSPPKPGPSEIHQKILTTNPHHNPSQRTLTTSPTNAGMIITSPVLQLRTSFNPSSQQKSPPSESKMQPLEIHAKSPHEAPQGALHFSLAWLDASWRKTVMPCPVRHTAMIPPLRTKSIKLEHGRA